MLVNTYIFRNVILMLYTTQGNHYFLMAPIPALRNKEVCLMYLWVLTMNLACELVKDMLSLLSKNYNKNNFGLYRDDGLAVLKNKSGPQSEQVKKNLQKIFKENGLDIIIQYNMKIVNYLDVTFNLTTELIGLTQN